TTSGCEECSFCNRLEKDSSASPFFEGPRPDATTYAANASASFFCCSRDSSKSDFASEISFLRIRVTPRAVRM
ncbi:coatomer subunit, partial [Moniliophthora roreri]